MPPSVRTCVAAISACRAQASRSSPQCAARSGVSVFRLEMTIGHLLMWMVLTGSRVTPSGSASARVNRRRRSVSASSPSSSEGSCERSQTISSLRLVGWVASGQTSASPPRSTPYMPEMCSSGRPCDCARVISACTASFLRRPRQKSNSRGCAWRSARARPMVARTSDSASCASSCTMPLATLRSSSRKDGRPSGWRGQFMPSGRSAQAQRTTSTRSQRPQPFCHSRA